MGNGPNAVWDFSTVDFDHPSVKQDTITCLEPYFTPFYEEEQTNYNLSNFCLKLDTEIFSPEDNDYSYYLLQNNSLFFIGNWAANGGSEQWFYSFDDLRKELIFPFTYLSSFSDTFESSYNDLSGSDWHYQSGTTIVVADGYGTLITPDNDTLFNILHIATNNTYVDSNDLFGVSNHTDVYYSWYSADFDGPILQVIMNSYTSLIASNIYYYKKIISPINEIQEIENTFSFDIFPNPANKSFRIKLSDIVQSKFMKIAIRDFTGKLVYFDKKHQEDKLIILPKLASGIYNVELICGNYSTIKKLIIK